MGHITGPLALPTALQAQIGVLRRPNIIARFWESVNPFLKKVPPEEKKVRLGRRKYRRLLDNFQKIMYDTDICLSRPQYAGLGQGHANRGDSGALYLQSATAGVNSGPRVHIVPSDLDKQR